MFRPMSWPVHKNGRLSSLRCRACARFSRLPAAARSRPPEVTGSRRQQYVSHFERPPGRFHRTRTPPPSDPPKPSIPARHNAVGGRTGPKFPGMRPHSAGHRRMTAGEPRITCHSVPLDHRCRCVPPALCRSVAPVLRCRIPRNSAAAEERPEPSGLPTGLRGGRVQDEPLPAPSASSLLARARSTSVPRSSAQARTAESETPASQSARRGRIPAGTAEKITAVALPTEADGTSRSAAPPRSTRNRRS